MQEKRNNAAAKALVPINRASLDALLKKATKFADSESTQRDGNGKKWKRSR